MPVLTLVDVAGIQKFIFASNRLRQVAGASIILQKATSDRPGGWIAGLGCLDNVIVAAGGNALLRFDDRDSARAFAAGFSRKTLDYAPELEVTIAHQEYEAGALSQAVVGIHDILAELKSASIPRALSLDLGICEECTETGHAASGYNQESQPISLPVMLREDAGQDRTAPDRFLPTASGYTPRFPLDLDYMGRTRGDNSLIGIVHIDANDTGSRIRNWIENCGSLDDDTFSQRYRRLSCSLVQAVDDTMSEAVRRVIARISFSKRSDRFEINTRNGFELYEDVRQQDQRVVFLPVRPIIAAGEDITFVCDGRLALDLASFAVERFGMQDIAELGRMSACAGVGIVHSHSPIIQAYQTAERLCKEAKRAVRRSEGRFTSALNWALGFSGATGLASDARSRAAPGSFGLTMRPYFLGDPDVPGTWQWLEQRVLAGETGFWGRWSGHKSKVYELGRAVREGRTGVRRALENWQLTVPGLGLPSVLVSGEGFVPSQEGLATPVIDVLELYDLHASLKGEEP